MKLRQIAFGLGQSASRPAALLSAILLAGCDKSEPEAKPVSEIKAPTEYTSATTSGKGKSAGKPLPEATSRRERQQREAAERAKAQGSDSSK
jgi:hypothetical protein